jgi:hypothetical protein
MNADLQVQYISDGNIMWKREEALSQIKQVEVFDTKNVNTDAIKTETDRLGYLKTMGDKDVSLVSIPGRIV